MAVEIRTPYLWTLQKPNGLKWKRHFKSIDAACRAMCGGTWYMKQTGKDRLIRLGELGYKVVPIAWSVKSNAS